jgi:DNA-binding transcriptional ArsR family regulator
MARMLPSRSSDAEESAAADADPRVIGLDSDDADAALSALSSDTSRTVLGALHERPDTPAALADRVDTSLQNAQYHLGKLADAGLIEVVDTVYSEKGREMKVYAPADRPLVVFAGRESDSEGLASALRSLLGAVGVLALASLAVQVALRGLPPIGAQTGAGGDQGVSTESATAADAADAAGQALGLPPGLLFFLGGLVVLVGILAVREVRRRADRA